jgi:hypothetical protein
MLTTSLVSMPTLFEVSTISGENHQIPVSIPALRSGPLPTRGRSTILAHIPIHIALSLIATDGLAPDPITHDRQIGPPKVSSLGGL